MKVQGDAFIRKGDNIRGEIDSDGDLVIRVGNFPGRCAFPVGASLTLFVNRDALATVANDLAALAALARQAADAQKASGVVEAKPTGGA